MLWLGFAAWTIVALAVVLLDRPAWHDAPPTPAARPAGPIPTTAVVQQ